jgi:membrane protease YdiL (CAAX protease family)
LTEPLPPEGAAAPIASPDDITVPPSFGLTTFSIEGRPAPGLFVVGWLATLIGGALAALPLVGVTGMAGAIFWVAGLATLAVGMVLLGGSQAVERRAAGAAYAGPSPVLVFIAVLATSQVAGFAVGLPLSLIAGAIPRPVGDLLGVLIQAGVFVGVVRLMVVGAEAMRWSEMGLVGRAQDRVRGLVAGAVWAGPIILVTAVLAAVAAQVAGVVPESPLPATGTAPGLLLHLAAGAVVAPVAEELLFRGFALTAWRRTVGARGAIVRSSIAFVLAHVLFVGGEGFRDAALLAAVGGISRIPVALALGWLYVRTGSLWAPIGLHAAYNAVLIILGESAIAG